MRDAPDAPDANAGAPAEAANTIDDNKDSSSDEELTLDDVNKMKANLRSASMPEKDINILGNILTELTGNSTTEEKLDGFVSVKLVACRTLNALEQRKTFEKKF